MIGTAELFYTMSWVVKPRDDIWQYCICWYTARVELGCWYLSLQKSAWCTIWRL